MSSAQGSHSSATPFSSPTAQERPAGGVRPVWPKLRCFAPCTGMSTEYSTRRAKRRTGASGSSSGTNSKRPRWSYVARLLWRCPPDLIPSPAQMMRDSSTGCLSALRREKAAADLGFATALLRIHLTSPPGSRRGGVCDRRYFMGRFWTRTSDAPASMLVQGISPDFSDPSSKRSDNQRYRR
jgi:hypothetical protein